jgi:hypothetical protein
LQQFGAGVGGPIRDNRLWFFVDYEQQLRNNPISVINRRWRRRRELGSS